MSEVKNGVIDWLLEEDNPSIRYRTLTELLDRPVDGPAVVQAKGWIQDSKAVQAILKRMHPDGYWLQKKASTGEMIGDGVEYGSYATTHFVLGYLAELGLDRSHPEVARAAERYLSLQQPDGNFWHDFSCLNGYNLRTFLQLGYRQDPRVQKTIDLMLGRDRFDNGYLCNLHEGKFKTREVKSCIRGSAKMLMAFAELPETWEHPRVLALIEYFIRREGLFRRDDLTQLARKDLLYVGFPFTWTTSVLEILLAFSMMGYGENPALARAWEFLDRKCGDLGRYSLDWTPSAALLKAGRKGEPNKWITFYVLLAEKYKGRL